MLHTLKNETNDHWNMVTDTHTNVCVCMYVCMYNNIPWEHGYENIYVSMCVCVCARTRAHV
jgi:hypothetical protein